LQVQGPLAFFIAEAGAHWAVVPFAAVEPSPPPAIFLRHRVTHYIQATLLPASSIPVLQLEETG
jgi:hypothetical protein